MAKSQIEEAVEFLKERGWEFRPAEKIEGVFKPVGKYDACLLYTSDAADE